MLKKGLIVKINSDTFTVKADNNYYDCKSRGKFRNLKLKPLVGDNVLIDEDKCLIEEVNPRFSELKRPAVANISHALIVTSLKKPDLNLTLLDKLISIIIINKIIPVIVLTKLDLLSKQELQEVNKLFKYYDNIGIKVFTNKDISKLKKYLKSHIATVCGQTGAGKSTLINKIDAHLNLATNSISESLGRGKHTTRIVELFDLKDFYIVDTPGFSAIDINNYSREEINNSFIEFRDISCKFNDCSHIKEIGCQVKEKVQKGEILKSRYDNYSQFIKESK